MTEKLPDLQATTGATFASGVALSFGNDIEALKAVQSGVALCDRSHWGRLLVTGRDRLSFLHNQSTNNFKRLQPGQGCDTVFITSTARTLDLASAYVTEDTVILLVSPNRRQPLQEWLDRYIFFGDQVALSDITNSTCSFSLIGPDSADLLQRLGLSTNLTGDINHHQLVTTGDLTLRVAIGSGLASPGYTLIANDNQAAALWQTLIQAGAVPSGEQVWEQLRIEQGRPKPDHELTENYNPLEAGLWQTISLDKGCYIGQETIARLHTYQGVKQQLWGIKLQAIPEPGTPVTVEGKKVGVLTSITSTAGGARGLAYIRTKAGSPGLQVTVGDMQGELTAVPFVSSASQAAGTA